MPIRIRINFRNPKHHLINTMTLTMEADGAAVPQVKKGPIPSRPGAIRFDVPDTAKKATLRIEIPKQNSASKTEVLLIVQHFDVIAGKPPRLEPRVFDGPPFMADGTKLYHPRLTEPATAGSGSGKVFELNLDTRFLRVTDFARSLGKLNTGNGLEWKPPMGSEVVLLEDTHPNPNPIVWYVLRPPALDSTRTKINVLIFYRPEMLREFNYKDVRDISPLKFLRYADDPSASAPFFVDQGTFNPYPNCAYERQLVQSGKPVLLAFPMPHVTSYGLAEGPLTPDTLSKFVRTLWMEGVVGGRADVKATLGRVGISGFSSGGNTALQSVRDFGNSMQELYLFDPGVFKGSELLKGWLAGNSSRKLRMIAGGYQQGSMALLNLPASMINSTDPKFWFTDKTYLIALTKPGDPVEAFDHIAHAGDPATAHTAPSVASGLFRVVAPGAPVITPLVLQGRFVNSRGQVQATRAHQVPEPTPSETEGASLARFQLATSPLKSDAEVASVATQIAIQKGAEPHRITALRHSWASCGGTSANGLRSATDYKGYLQSCLEKSDFS